MPIYIAAHKPATFPNSPLYKPLALGGAELGQEGVIDNQDDNISHLNKYYCELTGTYWIWKNGKTDIAGLCHYRRYFNFIPVATNHAILHAPFDDKTRTILEHPEQLRLVHALLDRYDVIVPRAIFEPHSVEHTYKTSHGVVEWESFIANLDLLYGRKAHSLDLERRFFIGNMLLCKRSIFDHYASQLFHVLDRVSQEVGTLPPQEGARYQPYRYPAYLGERFTSAFIKANKLSYYEAQILLIHG
ncbi:MAG: DUF4422 domain-containing protein [Hydrogenophilales bacterium]|nr:DUF4422 domain-containing protein [Hydrogenophilales bacterium]